jgi:hypothetical protein
MPRMRRSRRSPGDYEGLQSKDHRGLVQYFQCHCCGLVFMDPIPDDMRHSGVAVFQCWGNEAGKHRRGKIARAGILDSSEQTSDMGVYKPTM